jgi:uncharacterized protein YbjT (DUF2867 family)
MTTALIVGATGATGKLLLENLINNPQYTDILVLHYRATGFSKRDKVTEIIHPFDQLETLELPFTTDHVFCCLGTTIKKAKSKTAFAKVDFDYVVNTAKLGIEHGAKHFLVMSSIGTSSNAPSFYLKTKARMEQSIQSLNYPSVSIFRPSVLDGERQENRPAEKIGIFAARLLNNLPASINKYGTSNIQDVANYMVQIAAKDVLGCHIYESTEIRNHA